MTEFFLSPSLELEPVEETDKLLTEVKLVGETVGITKGWDASVDNFKNPEFFILYLIIS